MILATARRAHPWNQNSTQSACHFARLRSYCSKGSKVQGSVTRRKLPKMEAKGEELGAKREELGAKREELGAKREL